MAQILAGGSPDPALGKQSKQRSVHNNYLTLPVLLIMISNHYPLIYASPLNWLWLAALGVSGWSIRHFFNLKNGGQFKPEVLAFGLLAFVVVAVANESAKPVVDASGPPPTYNSRPCAPSSIVTASCAIRPRRPTRGCRPRRWGRCSTPPPGSRHTRRRSISRRSTATRCPWAAGTGMTDAERASTGRLDRRPNWRQDGRALMRRVTPQLLAAAAFAPFGDVIEASDQAEQIEINYGSTIRFNDLAAIDTGTGGGRAIVSLFRGKPLDPPLLKIFERHPLGSQAFVPVAGAALSGGRGAAGGVRCGGGAGVPRRAQPGCELRQGGLAPLPAAAGS